jgi:hypothetical protein
MPAQQSLRLHEESVALLPGQDSAETGEERTIAWSQSRAGELAPKNRHFMPEDDNLDGQIDSVRPLEKHQLQCAYESEVQKREGHGLVSQPTRCWRKSSSWARMTFLAPTRPENSFLRLSR